MTWTQTLWIELNAEKQEQPILMNKGSFYQLIDLLEPADVPAEIFEKLDAIQQLFEGQKEN